MSQALVDILQNPAIWRVGQIPTNVKPAIPTGYLELDRALPAHGWEQGAMTEILSNEQGIGEFSLLAPALRQATSQGKNVVLVAPPYMLFPDAWETVGISLNHVLLVTAQGANLLWVIEQASRSKSCGVIVAWTTSCRKELTYPALRRLHVAADTGGSTLILMRPQNVSDQASPAPTRIAIDSANGALKLRIVKRRGALLAQSIRVNVFPEHWSCPTIEHAQGARGQTRHPSPVPDALIDTRHSTNPRRLFVSR